MLNRCTVPVTGAVGFAQAMQAAKPAQFIDWQFALGIHNRSSYELRFVIRNRVRVEGRWTSFKLGDGSFHFDAKSLTHARNFVRVVRGVVQRTGNLPDLQKMADIYATK